MEIAAEAYHCNESTATEYYYGKGAAGDARTLEILYIVFSAALSLSLSLSLSL